MLLAIYVFPIHFYRNLSFVIPNFQYKIFSELFEIKRFLKTSKIQTSILHVFQRFVIFEMGLTYLDNWLLQ